jgi:hypothetical protein
VLADVDLGLVGEFLARHLTRCRCRRQRSRTVPTIRALASSPTVGTERILKFVPAGRGLGLRGLHDASEFAREQRDGRVLREGLQP